MAEPGEAPRAPQDATPADEARLFCLRVGAGRYALDAALVAEVVRLGPLTRLPAAPAWLPGVFAHRGEVLAVLDLPRLLGQPPASLAAGARAAVIRSGAWRLALVADAVEGLSAVPRAALEPPPAEGAGPVSAVGRDGRGPLAVLDLPGLVAAARSWGGAA
jgi:purine-binding chemotaxis protein CheW